jgi:allantoin racemase
LPRFDGPTIIDLSRGTTAPLPVRGECMKLWYQSLARETEATPYGAILERVIRNAADPGTEIHLRGIHESAGIGVHYRFPEYHDTREVIYNAMRAEREGFDAFLIGNASDSGILAAREVVNIPVLALTETSLLVSCMMGATVGLITVSDKWTPRIMENVRRLGMESRVVGAEGLNTSPLELKKAMVDAGLRRKVIDDFMASARRLLAKGAEVIIPAGGDVIVFLAEDRTFELERAPIVNGIVELVKMGEAAVRLHKHTGRFTSKRFGYSAPSGEYLQRIREFYGPDVYPGAK